MGATRWDPLRDLLTIQERMNRLFETALSGSEFGVEPAQLGAWTPLTDLIETDESIVVSCELPGLDRDRIDIKLTDNVLTISGERQLDRGGEGEQYHRIERAYGPFTRALTVPVGVDPERITATYRCGVLSISLPKRPEASPRKITVRVS